MNLNYTELLKIIILGVVEGVTEWLPISSTGHMILADEWLRISFSAAFKEMFLVVIQLGAILAVAVLYFERLVPFSIKKGLTLDRDILSMWGKIIVACLPAAVVGLLWDDTLNALFYNYQTVAIMLILFGVFFILAEKRNRNRVPTLCAIGDITYKAALIIGFFQLIAAVFPGTSRSGATILGGILIGLSRTVAAEFTFFLAVPVMLGASLLKLVKFGFHFTNAELAALLVGMAVAFAVSVLAIRFLVTFIKRHDFTVFGVYRILLGGIVLLYFGW